MFKEIRDKYENSIREKENLREFEMQVHSRLMSISDSRVLLKNGYVNEIVINRGGGICKTELWNKAEYL